jgi:tripartite-type tricarboxylate transporter receptor subunit TctC
MPQMARPDAGDRPTMSRMRLVWSISARKVFVSAALALAGVAVAQQPPAAWPTRSITMVVNVAPGSSVDVVARALSAPLQQALGQPVVIDNRSGAAGNIGAELVAQAAPDGHTLLVSPASTLTLNPFIYPKLKLQPFKDLVPVAAAARITSLLPVRDVEGLLAHARFRPQPLSYASPGAGSVPHLAAEVFKAEAGIAAAHVPYRGAAAALQDVLANRVDFVFDPGTAIPHIRAGRAKLLAVGTPQRSALFPDVPTLAEAGWPGFDASTTHGVFVPAGTPPAVVERLHAEIARALASPAVREQLASLGAEPAPMTPAQFRTLLENEARRGGSIVKERGISAE